MIVSMIAAMSKNRVIGKDNALPWHLPNDLRFFKESTMGKPIIMGRKTFESIGRPLPGRPNFVITSNPSSEYSKRHPGVWFVRDVEAAFEMAENEADERSVDEIMVVGGARIYTQALPLADRLYLTQVEAEIEGDTYFPEFDLSQWELSSEEVHRACEKNPLHYRFQILNRIS